MAQERWKPLGTLTPALQGLRVLEIAARSSAAFAGRLFADAGAEVTVIDVTEPAALGEHLRLYLDRGKRHITLALDRPDSAQQVRALAVEHDLVVTDLDPREIDRLGLPTLEGGRLRARVLITPFGMTGPYRDRPATTATILALSGHTFLLGEPGQPPLTLPGDYVGYQSALFAYTAGISALLQASRQGRTAPRTVEVSELEALASLHQHTTVQYTYGGHVRTRQGNRPDGGTYPYTILPCADGWLGMCIVPAFWEPFAQWLGPQWLTDPRFADAVSRTKHATELDQEIIAAVGGLTKIALEDEGQRKRRVPVGAVRALAEVLDDPQLSARGFWHDELVNGRLLRLPSSPYHFVGEADEPA